MRVLIVNNWFPPVRSGTSYYTSSLAHALVNTGHEVVVATLNWGPNYEPPPNLPFPVYRLPVWKLPKSRFFYQLELMGVAFTPGNHRRLKEIIRKHGIEVVHQVNHIFDTTFLSLLAARRTKVPIVGVITTPIQNQTAWKQAVMTLADRWTVGFFGVKRWDRVISQDRSVHDYVGTLYGPDTQARSVLIPYGVPLEALPQYEDRPPQSARPPMILHVGHIHPFRNPVQLVRAMPAILKAVPGARLVLAGRIDLDEPAHAKRSLKLTDEEVLFLGETNHEEIVRLMKQASVYASWVTGPYHSLGTAPAEAMLCETPVVNDLPEDLFGENTLRDQENIVLVNSLDPESIARAIIRLLQHKELRQQIGAAGRQFVLEHLSWDKIAKQMEQLYCTVLAGRASSANRNPRHLPTAESKHPTG